VLRDCVKSGAALQYIAKRFWGQKVFRCVSKSCLGIWVSSFSRQCFQSLSHLFLPKCLCRLRQLGPTCTTKHILVYWVIPCQINQTLPPSTSYSSENCIFLNLHDQYQEKQQQNGFYLFIFLFNK